MNQHTPLISCICITDNRPLLLQRAIACFDSQDYPKKELVISYPENDTATKNILRKVEEISNLKIVKIERLEQERLGTARNHAIALANGEYICIWDDDDWYDSTRIFHQYKVLKNGPFKASILLNVLLYNTASNTTYHSDYQELAGTLLCEKQTMLQTSYLDLKKCEDASIIQYLTSKNVLFRVIDMPQLYIYICHGNNALGERYFSLYFTLLRSMDESINSQVREVINPDQYTLIP
jgi:glycosyltransferase involved in cell wall biosynthesis